MTDPIQFEELYSSPRFTFTDVSCTGCDTPGAAEGVTAETKLVFVRAGSFVRQAAGKELFAEAGSVVVFHQGESYSTRHPLGGGDRCSSIGVRDDVLRALIAPQAPRRAAASVLRLPSACHTLSSALFFQHARVLHDLRQGLDEPCAVEEELAHLVSSYIPETPAPTAARGLERHHRLARQARELLAGCFRQRVPLTQIARTLDVSLFHLCRVFRAEVGLSLHRYRTRLRLRSALEFLHDPTLDLARLALDLGFSSQSHFTSAFRREYGSTPGAFRGPRRSRVASQNHAPPRDAGAADSP